jgi:carbon monoxide dehydrogenase subunit G
MQLKHSLKKSPDFVFNYLGDMQKFVQVHPVIFKIESLDADKYLVHEKLAFPPFPFTYTVVVAADKEKGVVSIKATVMKFTKIDMLFTIESSNGATVVTEKVHFGTFWPMTMILRKIFEKQHQQLFLNIGNVSE